MSLLFLCVCGLICSLAMATRSQHWYLYEWRLENGDTITTVESTTSPTHTINETADFQLAYFNRTGAYNWVTSPARTEIGKMMNVRQKGVCLKYN